MEYTDLQMKFISYSTEKKKKNGRMKYNKGQIFKRHFKTNQFWLHIIYYWKAQSLSSQIFLIIVLEHHCKGFSKPTLFQDPDIFNYKLDRKRSKNLVESHGLNHIA